jgi:enamine deaminase RidA (YjgF/YER057c/UK114 family)
LQFAIAGQSAVFQHLSRSYRLGFVGKDYSDRMPTSRILVSSESDFESAVGYSRAVRIGPHVAVAGTTGAGPADDIAAQTRDALRRIEIALQQVGAALTDVTRTRIYVTDISRWREVGAVHAQVFGAIRPAATMVEVSALITPELLVEIEADAYVDS